MRILFFTPQQLWPVNSGSRLRNVHLASALARRCSVTLLQILQPGDVWQEPATGSLFEEILVTRKRRSYTPTAVLKGLAGREPVTVLNYESGEAADRLRSTLAARRFDAVQMETSNLYSYLAIIRAAPGRPAVLLDWHNIDSELMFRFASETGSLAKRLVARRTAVQLADLETRLLGLCDAHSVVSERDREKLLAKNRGARIHVIPNGVDVAAFSVPDDLDARNGPQASLLFVGSMDYHANVDAVIWFVERVWPEVARRFPDLRFRIVGRSPGKEVRALASAQIEVTGTVEDVRPYYRGASAVVVPLRVGSGTRLKILEAMAMGVPVISTSLGAEGIAITAGTDILLADSEEGMLEAIVRVLSEGGLRERLAGAARRLVSRHYDWSAIGDRLYETHCELVESRVAR